MAPTAEDHEPEVEGRLEQGLFGTLSFADGAVCAENPTGNGTLGEFVAMSMELGRIATSSNAFAECLDTAIRSRTANGPLGFGPYRACKGDPYESAAVTEQVSRALNVAWSPFDVEVACAGGSGNASTHVGSYYANDEGFAFSDWLRENESFRFTGRPSMSQPWPWPMSEAAELAWHEVAHSNGYRHGLDLIGSRIECGYADDQSFNYQKNSMPYIIGDCVTDVMRRSQVTCGLTPGANECRDGEMMLIDGYNSSTCHCVADPKESGAIERDDEHGFALASGDFDADGYEDLAVGAPGESTDRGRVFVYRGTSTGLRQFRAYTQSGADSNEPGDQFGYALAAGDFNGDGFDDLAVGAPGEDIGSAPDAGAAYILVGSEDGLQMVARRAQETLSPTESGDRFGWSLAVGDFNADTNIDLAVGAPGEAIGAIRSGAVYILKGNEASVLSPWQAVNPPSPQTNDLFGHALAGVHLTGGEMTMLAVGSPGKNNFKGIAYLVTISKSTFVVSQTYDVGDAAGDRVGMALAAGDFDEDGDDDLAIGAPGDDFGSVVDSGAVYMRKSSGAVLGQWYTLTQSGSSSPEAGDLFGSALAAVGPGRLVAGAPGEAAGSGPASGTAFQFHYLAANNNMLVNTHFLRKNVIDVEKSGERFGYSVATGDFNGDGSLDTAVGAPGDEQLGKVAAGAVYTYRSATTSTEWERIDQLVAHRANISLR